MIKNISTKNTWINIDENLIRWLLNFEVSNGVLNDFLYNFSLEFIRISNKYKLIVPFPIDTPEDGQRSLKEYKTLYKNDDSGLISFIDANRSHLKNKLEGEPPFLSYITYYDENGTLLSNFVYKLRGFLDGNGGEREIVDHVCLNGYNGKCHLFYEDVPVLIRSFDKPNKVDYSKESQKIDFQVTTYTDIRFTENKFHRKYWTEEDGYENWEFSPQSNRVLAYRNTPRLNSFLRDLKALCLSFGGKWDFDPSPRVNYILDHHQDDTFDYVSRYSDYA